MPITSHTVYESPQSDGSSHIVLRLYDQDGIEYMQTFWKPAGGDITAIVSGKISSMDVQLAEQEFESLVGAE